MNNINLNGNSTPRQRLMRVMQHGLAQMRRSSSTIHQNNVGKTFYLLRTGEIITLRDWYKKEKPDYIVAGSYVGCVGTKKGRNL